MIGVALVSMMAMGVIAFQAQQQQMSDRAKLVGNLSAVKARLLATISSDSAWSKTEDLNSASSNLKCIGSTAGCIGVTSASNFDLYESNGQLVYSSTSYFELSGETCASSSACPIKFEMKWTPSCAATDTNCQYPLIQVTGTFTSTAVSGSINLAKYNIAINRSPVHSSTCPGALPVCAPGIAVCTSTGWTCVASKGAYCQGPVSWNDASTGVGPCSATIPASTVLHDTTTTVANTTAGETGNATYLCVPGEPNNGFILQPGADCAINPIPVAGACSSANGNGYWAASDVSSIGLCSAGTASVASVSGGAPWSWSCNGLNGGSSASCTAGQNGSCGGANGGTFASSAAATSAGLCATGSPSVALSGSGPWSWNCNSVGPGASASCSASGTAAPPTTTWSCNISISSHPATGVPSLLICSTASGLYFGAANSSTSTSNDPMSPTWGPVTRPFTSCTMTSIYTATCN